MRCESTRLQRSVIIYFVGRVVGNVVPFKLDR